MLKTFLLILSHKKSNFRDLQKLSLNNDNFIYYYFIGDQEIDGDYLVDEVNKIVYLNIPDNYESLSIKTHHALKFIKENYYDKIGGVFKSDDDIELNLDKLHNCIINNKDIKYFGIVNDIEEYNSDYHFNKCESKEINKKLIKVPKCTYCSGGGYYLDKSLLDTIIEDDSYIELIYEDAFVGYSLNKRNIYPTNIPIKGNGCYWKSYIPYRYKQYGEYCTCGIIKNRKNYNFCQSCNKIY